MYKVLTAFVLFALAIFPQSVEDNNRFFMGQSFEQAGNAEKAKEIYEQLYAKHKNNYQYFDALNRVNLLLKDYPSSIAIIEERLRINPNDVNLIGLLGKTYHMSGDEEKAFEAWDTALKYTDANPAIYRLVANYVIERRAFRKAIEILEKGKEVVGQDENFSHDLANIYALLMQYENAANEYCTILLIKPEQYNLVEAKILSYINKPEALHQTIKAVEEHKKNTQINNLLGRLYLEDKDYEKAYSVFLDLEETENKMGAELFRFAQYAYVENEFNYASKAFNEIINNYPESPYLPNAKLGYAKTLESGLIQKVSGNDDWNPYPELKLKDPEEFDKVISAYEELLRLYAPTDVGLESNFRIGVIKFRYQNKPDEAEEYFYKLITASPHSRFAVDAYIELGDINLVKGNLDFANENFHKIVINERAGEDKRKYGEYRQALINFYKGNFSESRDILARLAQNLKDYSANDAIELSLLLNTTMSDSSNLLLFAEAELLRTQRNYESAAEKYRQIYAGQGAFMLQHLSKIREAEMELALEKIENAVIVLEKIAEEKEKNIYADKALYLLGKIYQNLLENPAKAVEIFESLLVKFPNSLYIDEAREEILKIRNKLS